MGRCPISDATRAAGSIRRSSSSDQKVPSKSMASAASMADRNSGVIAATSGATSRRAPPGRINEFQRHALPGRGRVARGITRRRARQGNRAAGQTAGSVIDGCGASPSHNSRHSMPQYGPSSASIRNAPCSVARTAAVQWTGSRSPCSRSRKQPEDVIEIRVRQQHVADRTVARRHPDRVQGRERLDLRAQIGRSIDQKPTLAIGADGDAGLRAGGDFPATRGGAIRAGAVPLRQAAARRRAEESNANGPPLQQVARRPPRSRCTRRKSSRPSWKV